MPRVVIKGRSVPYELRVHGPAARLVPDYKTDEIGRLAAFLDRHTYTKEQYWDVYCDWSRGEALEGNRWQRHSGLGGTYIMQALMWYRFYHRPGSTIVRPSIILDALVRAALGGEASC
jgi:hypothetical protein